MRNRNSLDIILPYDMKGHDSHGFVRLTVKKEESIFLVSLSEIDFEEKHRYWNEEKFSENPFYFLSNTLKVRNMSKEYKEEKRTGFCLLIASQCKKEKIIDLRNSRKICDAWNGDKFRLYLSLKEVLYFLRLVSKYYFFNGVPKSTLLCFWLFNGNELKWAALQTEKNEYFEQPEGPVENQASQIWFNYDAMVKRIEWNNLEWEGLLTYSSIDSILDFLRIILAAKFTIIASSKKVNYKPIIYSHCSCNPETNWPIYSDVNEKEIAVGIKIIHQQNRFTNWYGYIYSSYDYELQKKEDELRKAPYFEFLWDRVMITREVEGNLEYTTYLAEE